MAEPAPRAGGALRVDVTGLSGLQCSLDLHDGSTVREAKDAIEKAIDIPVIEQRLLSGLAELPDDALVAAAGRPDEACVELTLIRRDPQQAKWLYRITREHWGIEDVPAHIRQDKEVVLAAIASDGRWRIAPDQARQLFGQSLRHASEELRQDKEVVLAAVASDGWSLRYASEQLRQDKEVVLAAVASDGLSLEHASKQLRQDKEVVLAAVASDGWSLRYASEELRQDKELVRAALAAINVD